MVYWIHYVKLLLTKESCRIETILSHLLNIVIRHYRLLECRILKTITRHVITIQSQFSVYCCILKFTDRVIERMCFRIYIEINYILSETIIIDRLDFGRCYYVPGL